MTKEDILGGLRRIEPANGEQWEKEIAQLVASLGTTDNIEIKSDIPNPMALTKLMNWALWAERKGFDGTEEIVTSFISDYLKYRVSLNRQGRSEIVRAISAINEKIHTTLTGRKEDGNL